MAILELVVAMETAILLEKREEWPHISETTTVAVMEMEFLMEKRAALPHMMEISTEKRVATPHLMMAMAMAMAKVMEFDEVGDSEGAPIG